MDHKYKEIIAWVHGRIEIYQKERFEGEIIPKYFPGLSINMVSYRFSP